MIFGNVLHIFDSPSTGPTGAREAGEGAAGSRNIQSVRTARDPHAATSHISRATSTAAATRMWTLTSNRSRSTIRHHSECYRLEHRGQYFSSLRLALARILSMSAHVHLLLTIKLLPNKIWAVFRTDSKFSVIRTNLEPHDLSLWNVSMLNKVILYSKLKLAMVKTLKLNRQTTTLQKRGDIFFNYTIIRHNCIFISQSKYKRIIHLILRKTLKKNFT